MIQATYEKFDDLLKDNPIAGFYNELEVIVDTTVPKFRGHQKAVEGVYQRLDGLGDKIKEVLSTEIDQKSIFAYRGKTGSRGNSAGLAIMLYESADEAVNAFTADIRKKNPGCEEDINDPQDYLFFAQSLIREVVHGKKTLQEGAANLEQKERSIDQYIETARQLKEFAYHLVMKTKLVVHELYMEKCDEIYQENDQLLGSIDTSTFSKESTQNTLRALAKMKENMGKTSLSKEDELPQILDYSIVLPSVLRMLKKEYTAFRENQAGYLEAEHQNLMADMRKALRKPPKLEPVPPDITTH